MIHFLRAISGSTAFFTLCRFFIGRGFTPWHGQNVINRPVPNKPSQDTARQEWNNCVVRRMHCKAWNKQNFQQKCSKSSTVSSQATDTLQNGKNTTKQARKKTPPISHLPNHHGSHRCARPNEAFASATKPNGALTEQWLEREMA